jgi:formate dehydrogenase maturation protein FdhE
MEKFKLRLQFYSVKGMDKISTRIIFEEYMKRLDFNKLFEKLQVSDKELLTKEIEHFTKEEAERRDQIIINYLEESGINRIVEKNNRAFISAAKTSVKR